MGTLPAYAQREFEEYLKCGRLEHGSLRMRCMSCHQVQLVAFSCKCRGFCPGCAAPGAIEVFAASPPPCLPRNLYMAQASSRPVPGLGFSLYIALAMTKYIN